MTINLRQYYKDNNLCTQCGKPNNNLPRVRCKICNEIHNQQNKKYRKQKIKQGLCPQCSQPTTTGANCRICQDKINQEVNKLKNHRAENKLCIFCCSPNLKPNTLYCYDCATNYRQRRLRNGFQQSLS